MEFWLYKFIVEHQIILKKKSMIEHEIIIKSPVATLWALGAAAASHNLGTIINLR